MWSSHSSKRAQKVRLLFKSSIYEGLPVGIMWNFMAGSLKATGAKITCSRQN